MTKKSFAIIGSNGYIGKHLVSHLKSMDADIYCYDIAGENASEFIAVDLKNKEEIKKINLDVDYIFFMAGKTGTYIGFDKYEDFIDTNEKTLLHLLDAIRSSNLTRLPRIIFPSSRLVYKGNNSTTISECDPKEAKTVYAINKLSCELILETYKNVFEIPYTIFRLCVPYGNIFSNTYSYGTIGFFIKQASENKDIVLYGDGKLKRTFTHIADISKAMIDVSLMSVSQNEIYNIGGQTLSLKQAAAFIAGQFGVKVKFVPWSKNDLLIESGDTVFDDSKLQILLGGFEYKKLF
jgi:UDP-glucose 4-epimerase